MVQVLNIFLIFFEFGGVLDGAAAAGACRAETADIILARDGRQGSRRLNCIIFSKPDLSRAIS